MSDLANFPIRAVVPKEETQAAAFLHKNPHFDGRGVVVAILDTGVDPGAPGLQATSDGKPKVIDLIDGSGSGDVDMSTCRKLSADRTVEGLNGRKLKIPAQWNVAPGDQIRVGTKRVFQLYPKPLLNRVKAERKKKFDEKQREAILAISKAIADFPAKTDSASSGGPSLADFEARLEQLKSLESAIEDVGPVYDVVLFRENREQEEGQVVWRAAVDTTETGDFQDAKLMGEYRLERQYATFSDVDVFNYCFNVWDDGNTLSIVVNAGSHGTHVAGIVGANFPESPELNGVAPGCQIIGIKIGDSRLGSMETGTALVRAFIAARNLKVDIINMSYGEPSSRSNTGRILELANQLVWKHNVVFVASASNSGPCLTTCGAPGGSASALIPVGAMVSPAMMDVQYSLRDLDSMAPTQYTWSSRGPADDGGQGPSISAPGGAITSVPNWTLHKSQLMNGTSMSSPNAAGCIALILSGLKVSLDDCKHVVSPYLVKLALENTAQQIAGQDKLTHGHGVLQVQDAFQWLLQHARDVVPRGLIRLEAAVTAHNAHKARGIYLREPDQTRHAVEENVEIRPIFHETRSTNSEKLQFEMRLKIVTTQPQWVSVPENFMLLNENRSFKVRVDPTKLPVEKQEDGEENQVFFAEILGIDSARPEAGPLFRVPVTVIKPRSYAGPLGRIPTFQWENVSLCPGKIYRKFLTVPDGATWAEITLDSAGFSTNRLIVLAAQSIMHPKQSTKFTLFDKYLWMQGDTRKVERIEVSAGRTLELLFGQYWSAMGSEGSLSVKIQFRGLQSDTTRLALFNYEEVARVNVRALCNGQETLAPRAVLCAVQRPLYPTSADIRPLSIERDGLDDGKVTYQMILSYTYVCEESNVQVITRVPNLSEVLYDSPHEAQFWMIHEAETKRLIAHGDAWPEWVTLPQKAKYLIRVQLRHEDVSILEKMKTFPLLLERQLPKDKAISLNIYNTHYNAISGTGSKFPSAGKAIFDLGHESSFFVSAPAPSAVPNWVSKGDTLLGMLQISKVEGQTWEASDLLSESKGIKKPLGAIKLAFAAPAKPKSTSSSANKSSATSSNANSITLQDQMIKLILDHLSALVNQNKFDDAQKFLAKLRRENPTPAEPSISSTSTSTTTTTTEAAPVAVAVAAEATASVLSGVIPGLFREDNKTTSLQLAVLEMKIIDGITSSSSSSTSTDPQQRRELLVAACQNVISRIDRDGLALYFGVRHTPEETAEQGKAMEEKKKILLDALRRKCLALLGDQAEIASSQPELESSIAEMRRWVDIDSGSSDYNDVIVKFERARRNYGLALRLLRKELGNNNSNITNRKGSEVLLELLQILGWEHLYDLERRNQLARFPPGPMPVF